ncbi:biotin--[acetyl-CoA-carboxylase] ligase [Mesobacillus jeotgali]|uniref:biotin--[acetyl-CoA-carboxylase] ligase n=1 Tax=Mesobacillus jeotgali TaxID=129985 RepID=UPI0009A677C8|nr:biotin--[acetyl-CoA-carboxylase] ligase [Mesobacillus jeotgali]
MAERVQSEIRKKLIDAFTNNESEYLSGQKLADIAGCSRTAVWKQIEELRKEGFQFEAIRRKGYKIVSIPAEMTADKITLGLKTEFLGRNLHYHESVESTQKIAYKLAYENAEEGTIVIAEEQTAGRGRMDRKWHSPKYTGIWMSILLRPKIPIPKAPQLTLITAVGVVQAIEEVTGLLPEIKWPNDIMINGKKITGILTELQAESDRINSVIIGIGINVNSAEEDFPEEIKQVASSLAIETGREIDREQLIRTILEKLEKLYLLYLEKGFFPIKLMWESYAVSIGKQITARTITGEIKGKAIGITEDGVLLIEDNTGTIHNIYSADIKIEG